MHKRFHFTALMVALAMVWVGFASSSFAFGGAAMEMAGMGGEHEMSAMSMEDCPSHKAGQMTMDTNTCAVACFGLATSVVHELAALVVQSTYFADLPHTALSQLKMSRIFGVPTPPPNFS